MSVEVDATTTHTSMLGKLVFFGNRGMFVTGPRACFLPMIERICAYFNMHGTQFLSNPLGRADHVVLLCSGDRAERIFLRYGLFQFATLTPNLKTLSLCCSSMSDTYYFKQLARYARNWKLEQLSLTIRGHSNPGANCDGAVMELIQQWGSGLQTLILKFYRGELCTAFASIAARRLNLRKLVLKLSRHDVGREAAITDMITSFARLRMLSVECVRSVFVLDLLGALPATMERLQIDALLEHNHALSDAMLHVLFTRFSGLRALSLNGEVRYERSAGDAQQALLDVNYPVSLEAALCVPQPLHTLVMCCHSRSVCEEMVHRHHASLRAVVILGHEMTAQLFQFVVDRCNALTSVGVGGRGFGSDVLKALGAKHGASLRYLLLGRYEQMGDRAALEAFFSCCPHLETVELMCLHRATAGVADSLLGRCRGVKCLKLDEDSIDAPSMAELLAAHGRHQQPFHIHVTPDLGLTGAALCAALQHRTGERCDVWRHMVIPVTPLEIPGVG